MNNINTLKAKPKTSEYFNKISLNEKGLFIDIPSNCKVVLNPYESIDNKKQNLNTVIVAKAGSGKCFGKDIK